MSIRRAVLLAVVLYLSADYCDPSVPGLFFFGTESFFVDSIDSRSASRPFILGNTSQVSVPDREVNTSLRNSFATVRVPARGGRRLPYSARAQIIASSSAAPDSSEDH